MLRDYLRRAFHEFGTIVFQHLSELTVEFLNEKCISLGFDGEVVGLAYRKVYAELLDFCLSELSKMKNVVFVGR